MKPVEESVGVEGSAPGSWQRLILDSACRALETARYADLPPTAESSLSAALDAIRANDSHRALRQVDRAWRATPNSSEVIGSIYARLLSCHGQEHESVLRLLDRSRSATADGEAIRFLTYQRLQRTDEARQTLNTALADYCVVPGGLLAHAVNAFLDDPDNKSVGWIGRDANLEFIGALSSAVSASALALRLDSGAEFMQPIKTVLQDGRPSFRFKPGHLSATSSLTVSVHGATLLGSGCPTVPAFGLDGRSSSLRHRARGWVRVAWLPSYVPTLRLEDEQAQRIDLGSLTAGADAWTFDIDLTRVRVLGARVDILARLPDGTWAPLPDSPLLLEAAVNPRVALSRWKPGGEVLKRRRSIPKRSRVDIVIPVFAGRSETLACIESVLNTAPNARVLVVDDDSQDDLLSGALQKLRDEGRIVLLRNAVNAGFVRSVNRGLAYSSTRDAVILNSDTVVFGDWLRRLRDAAYSSPEVGTATPFSNNGSIASYPRTSEDPTSLEAAAGLHALAAQRHPGVRAAIPVGVGFCLYVRRDCLEEVGELDADVFGKGYGEETDFCLRARELGWSHVLAADVYVYHAGGVSFGSARNALLQRSQRLLNLRHPGFDRYIDDFLSQDPVQPLRRALDERRVQSLGRRFMLLVTVSLPGGIDRFVAERARTIREQGMLPLVLRPAMRGGMRRCQIVCDELDVPNLEYEIPAQLPALNAFLRSLSIQEIEFEHFLGLDPRVVDSVRALGAPYDVVIHDYAWICPRVTLVDGRGRYCGEPSIHVCETCVKTHGSELGEKISVARLRQRSETWLRGARQVFAPSWDAAARLQHYVKTAIEVRAPTAASARATAISKDGAVGGSIRVALIGALGDHKGYRVILACAKNARARRLPLEFVLIGYSQDDAPLLKTGKVFITGAYESRELPRLLQRERPHVAFLPSVWPETWSYTVDEALSAQIPIVAFDIGAVAERLRGKYVAALLPLDMQATLINDKLIELATQSSLPPSHDMAIMPHLEEKQMEPATAAVSPTPDALSASVQMLPLPAGLYLFSVRTASTLLNAAEGSLRLPAVHVGLGPGVRSDQVEFVSGPTTGGAWLFAKEDCLVTKINGAGATLVLTSIRGPGGESLGIKVERLDGRTEMASASQSALAAPTAHTHVSHANGHDNAASTIASTQERRAHESALIATQISAHIRTRGDMTFRDTPWAGRVGPGLWIESFCITPVSRFEARDIEYKGLTGSGFETPWLSDATMCGTKGMAVPLVGFAIRLKASAQSAAFDCEYSGYFKSGATVGPLRNGAPCRSTVANDPLEGLQVVLRKRSAAEAPAEQNGDAMKAFRSEAAGTRPMGPSFGRYREDAKSDALQTGRQDSAGNAAKRRPTRRA